MYLTVLDNEPEAEPGDHTDGVTQCHHEMALPSHKPSRTISHVTVPSWFLVQVLLCSIHLQKCELGVAGFLFFMSGQKPKMLCTYQQSLSSAPLFLLRGQNGNNKRFCSGMLTDTSLGPERRRKQEKVNTAAVFTEGFLKGVSDLVASHQTFKPLNLTQRSRSMCGEFPSSLSDLSG